MSDTLPTRTTSAYHDLLQLHLRAPERSLLGSPIEVRRGGRTYLVARGRRRPGGPVEEDYLGVASDQLRLELAEKRKGFQRYQDWKRQAADLVAQLRAARCLTPDSDIGKLLAALSQSGFFRAGGVVGGTHAFRFYPLELGRHPPDTNVLTNDIDVVAPGRLELSTGDGSTVVDQLTNQGLTVEPIHSTADDKPFCWLINGDVQLDVLTPVARGGDARPIHKGLGVKVQSLRYIEYALVDPIQTVSLYREGALISIPQPQRFALHKLVVSEVRSGQDRAKSEKDRNQAAWLIDILVEDRPSELYQAWEDLVSRGPKWEAAVRKALNRLPATRRAIETVIEEFGSPGFEFR